MRLSGLIPGAVLSRWDSHDRLASIMEPDIVKGDLLDQDVEVIVNAWNRNIIPWWLLIPQGVSRAIKKKAGYGPFWELARHGAIPLGGAVLTSAGQLNFKGIIHVAGINLLWFATETSIRGSVRSAMDIVNKHGFESVAFPIVGSGSGNRSKTWALGIMVDEFMSIESCAKVIIVEYMKTAEPSCL
jgi:O-acetyl-ADP-ribose deacetylase